MLWQGGNIVFKKILRFFGTDIVLWEHATNSWAKCSKSPPKRWIQKTKQSWPIQNALNDKLQLLIAQLILAIFGGNIFGKFAQISWQRSRQTNYLENEGSHAHCTDQTNSSNFHHISSKMLAKWLISKTTSKWLVWKSSKNRRWGAQRKAGCQPIELVNDLTVNS